MQKYAQQATALGETPTSQLGYLETGTCYWLWDIGLRDILVGLETSAHYYNDKDSAKNAGIEIIIQSMLFVVFAIGSLMYYYRAYQPYIQSASGDTKRVAAMLSFLPGQLGIDLIQQKAKELGLDEDEMAGKKNPADDDDAAPKKSFFNKMMGAMGLSDDAPGSRYQYGAMAAKPAGGTQVHPMGA